MKHLRFLPLTFLAGVHGFDLFAPYAAFVLTAVPLVRQFTRTRRQAQAPAPARLPAAAVAG